MRDVRGVPCGSMTGGARWCGGVGVAGNDLGAEGGRAVGDGLKHNSTLTELNLDCEFAPLYVGCVLGWVFIWCGESAVRNGH